MGRQWILEKLRNIASFVLTFALFFFDFTSRSRFAHAPSAQLAPLETGYEDKMKERKGNTPRSYRLSIALIWP